MLALPDRSSLTTTNHGPEISDSPRREDLRPGAVDRLCNRLRRGRTTLTVTPNQGNLINRESDVNGLQIDGFRQSRAHLHSLSNDQSKLYLEVETPTTMTIPAPSHYRDPMILITNCNVFKGITSSLIMCKQKVQLRHQQLLHV